MLETAIPLEAVAERAERLGAELQALTPREPAEAERAEAAEIRARLEAEVASRLAGAEAALASAPSPARLRQLEEQLLELRQALKEPEARLDAELAQLQEALAQLETKAALWEKTAAEAREAAAGTPTLRRIAAVRRDIEETREQVASRRNRILGERDELVDPAGEIERMLAQIREAIGERLGGALSTDQAPIWSERVRSALREELGAGWSDPLADQVARLVRYVQERRGLLGFQLALFLALALGLRALGSKARRRAEESYDLRQAELVFELPTAMALLIVLALTPRVHPLAPSLFDQLVYIFTVLPAALIVHRLSPPSMTPLVLVLPVLFLVDRIRDIAENVPALERLLYFGELVGALAFLLWLLRPSRLAQVPAERMREPFFRVAGTTARLAAGLVALAILAEAIGLGSLARLVGNGTLAASYSALFAYALLKVAQSLVAYALVLRPLRLLRLVSHNRRLVRGRLDRGLQLLALLGWLYLALSIFELADPLGSLVSGLLGVSLEVGSLSVSLGDLLVFALTVWLSFKVARFVDFVLHQDVFPRTSLPRGVPYAMSNLVRYVLIFLGFLAALAATGIQLSNLTVIVGGLGVGIGFGLQNVVNNFVSGLILLFERPLNVGDAVQLHSQGLWGEIRRIGIRASVIRTWDGAEVIVPNGQLISEAVTNWTLSDRRRRLELTVGVEYGTDAQRVIDLLTQVASDHPAVLDDPPPLVLFLGFGPSSLDFELRAWIADFDVGLSTRSELSVAVQRALAEAGIGVPFPQRDLHLRSVSPEVASEVDRATRSADERSGNEG